MEPRPGDRFGTGLGPAELERECDAIHARAGDDEVYRRSLSLEGRAFSVTMLGINPTLVVVAFAGRVGVEPSLSARFRGPISAGLTHAHRWTGFQPPPLCMLHR